MAESCAFVKQSLSAIYCGPPERAPLLPKLRGKCAEFLREVSLARLSAFTLTHLCRFTVRATPGTTTGFSRQTVPRSALARGLSSRFDRVIGSVVASPVVLTGIGAGIFNLQCIEYALRPLLSSRLTLSGRTLPRKPWVYGDQDFHLVYRYSCLHSHWLALRCPFPGSFAAPATLSYRVRASKRTNTRSLGTGLYRQSFSARPRSMSQLLRIV